MNMFVKICGIRNKKDLLCALENGADAIGFVTYVKSPRFVTSDEVRVLTSLIPKEIKKVAVSVDDSLESLSQYIAAGIDTVQLHGAQSAEFAKKISVTIWDVLRLQEHSQIQLDFHSQTLLLDHYSEKHYGGTGKTVNWQQAAKLVQKIDKNIILAGGLSPENIQEAITTVKPFGVDVSSGIEESPGIKDHDKMKQLFEKIQKIK